jgi:endo-1,4-beta-xylanase
MASSLRDTFIICLALFVVGCSSSLKETAQSKDKSIGVAISSHNMKNSESYKELIRKEFNILVPEYEMKFDFLRPSQDSYQFASLDEMAKLARDNQMKMRGHTFVWFRGIPKWLLEKNYSSKELELILTEHITKVMTHFKTHYPGLITSWDIVNESILENGEFRPLVWSKIGKHPYDHIRLAYATARKADPEAKLFYNDWHNHDLSVLSNASFELVKRLKNEGLVDGVGFQLHVNAESPPKMDELKKNFDRYTELGLEIHLTELDVRVPTNDKGVASSEWLEKQAKIYKDIVALCTSYKPCTTIVVWGLSDKYSWVPHYYSQSGAAHIFDENYKKKPAYKAVLEGFQD